MADSNGSGKVYVHELHATNIKKLRHVGVKLKKGANRVVGENAQGKSTFINLVKWALGGAAQLPKEIITRGEERAEIVLKFGEFTVERRFRKNERGGEDSTLVLIGPDGGRVQKPQTALEAFYDKYCFDPLEFMRMEPAKQLEVLRRLGNLNFGPLEAKRARLYEDRSDVNRRGGDLKARFTAMPTPPADLPEKPVNVDELLAEQNRATEARLANERERQKLRELQQHVDAWTRNVSVASSRVAELEQELAEAHEKAEKYAASLANAMEAFNAHNAKVAELKDPATGDLVARISSAQATNLWFEKKKMRDATEKELEQLRADSQRLSDEIAALDKQKAEAIAAVKFPVDGLAFADAGPLFNGFALSEASMAEQIRVSTAIGFALHTALKLMIVRDASLLGKAQLRLLEEEAERHEGQLLIEYAARDAKDLEVLLEEGDLVVREGEVTVHAAKQTDLGIVVEGRQP